MKKIVIFLLAAPAIVVLLFLLLLAVARQQGFLSKTDLDFLVDLGKRDGPGAVVATIRTHVLVSTQPAFQILPTQETL